MTLRRYSSRTQSLDAGFLLRHLVGARSYKRIAGYFTSSLFEVAGEALEAIPEVRIVCNVDIHPDDLKIAQLRDARLLGRWNERALEAEVLLHRERYRRLDAFLRKHGQAVRVAPDEVCGFVHGKAGVLTLADGRRLGFIGSMNETRSGWRHHYEILWEDESAEGIAWIEEEFEFLWNAARPLPDVVIREVHRRSHRREVTFTALTEADDLAPATLIESPLYREGQQLQPWQQGFLTECLRHYRLHGVVRLLLADEVGLGKTLSLATAALTLCLLSDRDGGPRRPVVIFAPATLTEQWQTEMLDKLGIPAARWDTIRKVWVDAAERAISPAGREQIARCPLRIGIVSTGLMVRDSLEKQYLLGLRFGTVILDEAHKARTRQGIGRDAGTPNELLAFMRGIAGRSDHVLLGTATPVQTRPDDLWDLLGILHQQSGRFIFGHDLSRWHHPDEVLDIIAGRQEVVSLGEAWELLRSPLPLVDSTTEPRIRRLYTAIRQDLGLGAEKWQTNLPVSELSELTRELLEEALEQRLAGASFFQRENPLVRHVVLRKRQQLEDAGLLSRVGVLVHPDRNRADDLRTFDALFEGIALRTSPEFRAAYEQVRAFGKSMATARGKGGSFMKNLLEQRICSSIQAGLSTARKLLRGDTLQEESDDCEIDLKIETPSDTTALERLIEHLERLPIDPKMAAIVHFLEHEKWLELGVIIFSQYYETARWLADRLAERYPDEAIGLYAGADRSRLYLRGDSVAVERETLKRMVAEHDIRLMLATDAACEGLNLQTLGTLINIDLPWNPTRLEQRIGRIKRFGQKREMVDMLNLVFEQTVDETIYQRLSERMRDCYDLFGSLPDTIRDEWIDDIETLGEKLDEFINAQHSATGFDLRYTSSMMPQDKDWRDCAAVLSRRDFANLLSLSWS